MNPSWPLLDGVARQHLAAGAVLGRRVHVDVSVDAATEHVQALLAASGADVVADPSAELVVHPWQVSAGDAVVEVPALDATGDAHALVRAVVRLTNRRLAATRVGVVGFGAGERVLAATVRALGGRVVVVDEDPLHRLAALTDGHDVGDGSDAAIVYGRTLAGAVIADGAVVAGPLPAAVGDVVDEPRRGMWRVSRGDREVFVLDPGALAADRPAAWLDVTWAARLVTLAYVARSPVAGLLPLALQRELAAAALDVRGRS